MPMKGNREDWADAHRNAAETLLEWLKEYETIAYPVLGDPGIYAYSSYLMEHIAPHHPCKVIPGVPAMCAAAAEFGIPLCKQGERLLVIDSLEKDDGTLDENTVLMKAEKNWGHLEKLTAVSHVYLARNIGLQDQMLMQGIAGYGKKSYFTTAILKRKK